MRRTSTHTPRAGFTLVELLVVITILAILVSLTAAAVVKVIGKGDELKARNDVSQLAGGIQTFKTEFAVSYVPSRLVLPPGADAVSKEYISRLWTRINPVVMDTSPAAFAYWGVPGTQPVVLYGDQCLVFFLGGKYDPTTNSCLGFSSSATDPMALPATSPTRKGPFYDGFTPDRLKMVPQATMPNRSPAHPSFVDAYGAAPYIYFSSKKAGNDYDTFGIETQFGVTPYATAAGPPPRFANPNSFQIICAGKDGAFGPGGLAWAGAAGGGPTATGADDMANFYPTLLGISPQ